MTSEHSPATHAALDAEYEILRELGRGGTALVYLARERASGEEVAIKLIRSRYIEDEEAQARFAREARLVAQLHHPNIVPVRAVLDLGTAGLAIVMAHVTGRTLKQRIKQDGPLPADDAERILRDIGGALEAAHASGIVHRDVKPENIFVDDEGRALLADFGLARSMTPDTALTMAGVALGTPAYMAPEQIDGNELDGRADVYSLGLVAWEMLIGRRAWNGEGLYAILYHQKHELPPDVRELRGDIPDRLAEVIARAIEKRRDARWSSVREMLDALDESTPLALTPRRVGGGGETMRFVRPPLPTVAPSPMYAVEAAAPPVTAMAVPSRRLMTLARTATVAGTLSVAALAVVLIRGRSYEEPALPPAPFVFPVQAGDVAKPVSIPAAADTHVVARPDTAHAPSAAVATAPQPATPAPDTARRPVALPALVPRQIAVTTPPVDKPIANSSTNSVWGGPPPLTPRLGIAAGGTHTCSINPAGQALCWGNNDHGQTGSTAAERTTTPFAIGVVAKFVAISAGSSHTCAIDREGAAWCWGDNDHGQAGDRELQPRVAPVRVADQHVFWAISAGDTHTCAVDAYGVPWCWGSNSHNQLGSESGTESAVPVMAGRGANRFTSITVGSTFTCGLSAAGRASCWGENSAGQLGDGSNFDRALPVNVASLQFKSLTAGSAHVCGITTDGDAYCWGRNTYGQLGDGGTSDRNTPVRVRGDAKFISITAGANHTCAVGVDGTGYCWGQNTFGQLGTGGVVDIAQPTAVADAHVFSSINAFGSHTCGLTRQGEAFCWGKNTDNQLGDGTQTHRARPVRVVGAIDR